MYECNLWHLIIFNKISENVFPWFPRLESTARTSESSEEFLEEEPEQSVIEFEDESSDKDVQPAPETQPGLEKQEDERVSDSLFFLINFYWNIVASQCCVILLYSKVNQLYVYIYPLLFGFLRFIYLIK